MDRRELLKMIALLTGGAVIGGEVFLSGCKNESHTGLNFSADDINFLNEVGETILPTTQTPGAKAANVGQFMTVMVNDCYEEPDQQTFHSGIKKLNDACEKKHGHSFMKATPQHRHELLVEIDNEAKEHQKKRNDFNSEQEKKEKEAKAAGKEYKRESMEVHYFTMMKQLTLTGFFTSEIGMTKVLRFNPVPGRYEGCIDYKKGDKLFSGLGG